MTTLVLGADGQLGRHLRTMLPTASFWTRNDLDLSRTDEIGPALTRLRPTAIINAAAYTAVDRAESESDLAWRINADAPIELARFARDAGIPLAHISTDYVFDGEATFPYTESTPVRPLSVYGRSKLGAELGIAALCPHAWIVRTSWVFSEHGSNFVKTMLRLGSTNENLRIVDDQYGTPTYAGHLAMAVVSLFQAADTAGNRVPGGTYHATGGPAITWKQFADVIFDKARNLNVLTRTPMIQAIETSGYPTPARRPKYSVLQPSQYFDQALPEPIDWRSGLVRMLQTL
ncbi:MAG: dTDP-4-dehydrorhamnose reductase [Pseudomonadales bacterium]|nr:dTDP-4-dehydrorhamnose reductase [Pseudomonadales bacterium]